MTANKKKQKLNPNDIMAEIEQMDKKEDDSKNVEYGSLKDINDLSDKETVYLVKVTYVSMRVVDTGGKPTKLLVGFVRDREGTKRNIEAWGQCADDMWIHLKTGDIYTLTKFKHKLNRGRSNECGEYGIRITPHTSMERANDELQKEEWDFHHNFQPIADIKKMGKGSTITVAGVVTEVKGAIARTIKRKGVVPERPATLFTFEIADPTARITCVVWLQENGDMEIAVNDIIILDMALVSSYNGKQLTVEEHFFWTKRQSYMNDPREVSAWWINEAQQSLANVQIESLSGESTAAATIDYSTMPQYTVPELKQFNHRYHKHGTPPPKNIYHYRIDAKIVARTRGQSPFFIDASKNPQWKVVLNILGKQTGHTLNYVKLWTQSANKVLGWDINEAYDLNKKNNKQFQIEFESKIERLINLDYVTLHCYMKESENGGMRLLDQNIYGIEE